MRIFWVEMVVQNFVTFIERSLDYFFDGETRNVEKDFVHFFLKKKFQIWCGFLSESFSWGIVAVYSVGLDPETN